MPVWAVKTGVAATHYAELYRIGACVPTQAITTAQQARLNFFFFTSRAFLYFFLLSIAPIMQSKGGEL